MGALCYPLDRNAGEDDHLSVVRVIASALLAAHLWMPGVYCSASKPSSDTAAYGSKVGFKAGRTLCFPDFDLTYTGKRHVIPPQYPRGWWIYDFKVRHKGNEQTISWSAGTGDIGPDPL